MKKTFTIHAGFEKTGSTAIQKWLAAARTDIGSDILYPILSSKTDHHFELYQTALAEEVDFSSSPWKEALADFRGTNVIVSCEHFSFLSVAALNALRHLCAKAIAAGFEVHVVAAVRDAISFLRSLYFESIKWNNKGSFGEFVASHSHRLWVSRMAMLNLEFDCRMTFVRFEARSASAARVLLSLDERLKARLDLHPLGVANASFNIAQSKALLEVNRLLNSESLTKEIIILFDKYRSIGATPTQEVLAEMTNLSSEMAEAVANITIDDPIRRALHVDGRQRISISHRGVLVVE